MLAAAPPQEQKQMLGERLFLLIQTMHSNLAGKITGMLLEIDSSELLHMLESPSLSAATWMKLWRSYRLIMPRKKVPRSQKKFSSPDKALACLLLHVDLSSVSQDLAIEGTLTYIVHSAIFRCVDPWKQAVCIPGSHKSPQRRHIICMFIKKSSQNGQSVALKPMQLKPFLRRDETLLGRVCSGVAHSLLPPQLLLRDGGR
eukprot:bmy_06869T0